MTTRMSVVRDQCGYRLLVALDQVRRAHGAQSTASLGEGTDRPGIGIRHDPARSPVANRSFAR